MFILFGEVSSNIYEDTALIQFFGITCCDLDHSLNHSRTDRPEY